jgi:hypothetical protein
MHCLICLWWCVNVYLYLLTYCSVEREARRAYLVCCSITEHTSWNTCSILCNVMFIVVTLLRLYQSASSIITANTATDTEQYTQQFTYTRTSEHLLLMLCLYYCVNTTRWLYHSLYRIRHTNVERVSTDLKLVLTLEMIHLMRHSSNNSTSGINHDHTNHVIDAYRTMMKRMR